MSTWVLSETIDLRNRVDDFVPMLPPDDFNGDIYTFDIRYKDGSVKTYTLKRQRDEPT